MDLCAFLRRAIQFFATAIHHGPALSDATVDRPGS